MHEIPVDERPRERLLRLGPQALADAELLALLLRTGTRAISAIGLANQLLRRFGGVAELLAAPAAALQSVSGIGTAKCAELCAVSELARRALESRLRRDGVLDSPRACGDYLRHWLATRPYEVFACLFLDNRHRVLAAEELFRGSIDGASVHPREVVRRAIDHNAAALIVAHNHPSGVAEPSAADIAITRRLHEALALVEVRLLDHLIVGEGEPVSLAARGLI
jgi:DNA repair protein RadC